jgi:GDP-4-dehydro-6-deoxy-D-mannose reductase
LITGAEGFLGRHIVAAVRAADPGARIVRLVRTARGGRLGGDQILANLEEPGLWQQQVASLGSEFVVHAAGRTPPAPTEALYRGNVASVGHLLDAVRRSDRRTRLVLIGSAAELGPVPASCLPADESCPCRPRDAYGLSKWAATRLALDAQTRDRLDIVVARPFNPIGPGQPPHQVFGRFARRLLQCPVGEALIVGDVSARRDFVDVRDVARAVVALACSGRPGSIYHVGTGVSRSVGEGLAALLAVSGRHVTLVTTRNTPTDCGDDSRAAIGRIVADTGWQPEIAFEQSLRDLWTSLDTARGAA